MFVWKRPKINEKEAGDGPFFKELLGRYESSSPSTKEVRGPSIYFCLGLFRLPPKCSKNEETSLFKKLITSFFGQILRFYNHFWYLPSAPSTIAEGIIKLNPFCVIQISSLTRTHPIWSHLSHVKGFMVGFETYCSLFTSRLALTFLHSTKVVSKCKTTRTKIT